MKARRVVVAALASVVIFNVVLLCGAWAKIWSLWVFAALIAVIPLMTVLVVDPQTLRDRAKNRRGSIDPVRLVLIQVSQTIFYFIGPLDVGRLHIADTVPEPLRIVALPLAVGGSVLVMLSVRANRFFMPAIRIQADRGHTLVTGGPYRFVRHPGYAGMIMLTTFGGLMTGSWLALLAGLIPATLFISRTADEDRFLQAQLPGYPEFAARTRYRIIPGVW